VSTILLVDDVKAVREQFRYDLRRKTGFEVLDAENGRQALDVLSERDVDVVILDLEMPVMDGLEMLEVMSKKHYDDIPVIVYTGKGSFQLCVRAVQLGAYNFFDKEEIEFEQLIRAIENALEHRKLILENRELRRAARQDSPLIGGSPVMKSLKDQIAKIAAVPSNVVILGESGTGKELVARELHRLSPRAKKPFVAVNCAAIPENLVESELFGYEKGAFSGAVRTAKGKFELANNGALFLDEIGDMPLPVQAKLLRVLQEGELTRLGGGDRLIKVDVRVIAATHRDLEDLIHKGAFRRDLYYRLCTHLIQVPPLRQRLEDIAPLSAFFMERLCENFGMPQKSMNKKTVLALQAYHWRQNNVRELQNIVERMIIQCDGKEILPEHIPPDIRQLSPIPSLTDGKTFKELKDIAEKNILLQALHENNWHITNTARALNIANHSNLLKMMRRLNIKKPSA